MRTHALAVVLSLGALGVAAPARAHGGGGDWPMYNHDAAGSRHQTAETTLTPWNAHRLRTLWQLDTPGAVTGTPAVVADRVYIGDWARNFYKLRADDGHTLWTAHTVGPISASALVRDHRVIFGDQLGYLYGLDQDSGAIAWQIQPNPHPLAAIFGSAVPVGRYVAIGISSNEEQAAADPSYPCCSFRGSVVLLDPVNGQVKWQTYFISQTESLAGSAGATVWGTPTYDEELDLLFVGTSNNYSYPATARSDAFLAIDPHDGHIVWENQRIQDDVSNFNIPWHENIDAGLGDSPQIYRLLDGRKVVGAGSKNGVFWILDARSGQLVGERRIQGGGSLGGLFADSAHAYGLNFANGIDWLEPFDFSVLPTGGLLTAFTGDLGVVLWQKKTPHSVNQSGVAVANAVVYFSSCNPGTGDRLHDDFGTLYAVGALTGHTYANVRLDHCALSGPAISNGRVFVGSGNMFQFAVIPPGTITAIGL